MSVGWRNGCGGKQKGWVVEREKGKRGKLAREWLTDVEGPAYSRSAADGKKCDLEPRTCSRAECRVVMLTQFPVGTATLAAALR